MKRLSPGLMLAGLGMSAAISLLMLFAAGVVRPIALSAACLFLASLMTWVPIREEHAYLFASIEYAFVSGAALIICRGSVWTYLYILLFGAYAIIRFYLRTHIDDRFLTVLIRLLIFNVMSAVGLAFAQFVLHYDAMTLVPHLSVYAVFGIVQGIFIVFMLLYKFFAYLFDSALRNILLPRR
ncbi:MAG: hypothetical protein J5772_05455 [Clostridia bacterium]|nr:hypothetical protein [Clostridia bacterium]